MKSKLQKQTEALARRQYDAEDWKEDLRLTIENLKKGMERTDLPFNIDRNAYIEGLEFDVVYSANKHANAVRDIANLKRKLGISDEPGPSSVK